MQRVVEYLTSSRDLLTQVASDELFVSKITEVANEIVSALNHGKKLLLVGNGGSAADAQHIAGELMVRFMYDRAPLAAIALTTDTSVLTAVGNDYGYEHLFERQVVGLGSMGDVLLAISTSGRSPNILNAIGAARKKDMLVIGLTGRDGGDMASQCQLCINVPSDSTPLIQQIHITVAHIICELIEESLFPRDRGQVQLASIEY